MITTIATLLSPYLFKWGVSSLDNAEQTARRVAWFIVLAVIVLVLFIVLITGKACYTNSKIDATGKQIDAIRTEQSNATVQKDAVTIEANKAKANTDAAKAEREAVVKKLEDARRSDSAEEQADTYGAMKRFCESFPADSACKK